MTDTPDPRPTVSFETTTRRAAFSVVVIASLLIGVTMLSQRARAVATGYAIESSTLKVEAANASTLQATTEVRLQVDQNAIAIIRLLPKSESSKVVLGNKLTDLHKQIGAQEVELEQARELVKSLDIRLKSSERHAQTASDRADWLDLAHVTIELGLILSAITLFTRKPDFWYAGLLAAGMGFGLVAVAYTALH